MVAPHDQQPLIESLSFIAEYSIIINDEQLREQQKVPANQDELAKSIHSIFSQIAQRGHGASSAKVYAFTETDKQHLIDLLAKSYLLAKSQAYNRAISHTKHVVTIRKPWQPSERDVKHAQKWATTQVDSIVETYETLLQHAIEQMAEQPHEALGDVIGKVKDVISAIGDWFKGFLPWKTQQIADQTWSEGDNDGTEQFIGDVQDDENVDEVVSGGRSMLRVVILPANSSSDFCSDYAGHSFSLDDDSVPEFPAHVGCIHYREMTIFDENESSASTPLIESVQNIPEIILFLDIDGVFSMANGELPAEKIGDVWAWPIPNTRAILQAIDQDSRIFPVWLSHWRKQSTAWNDYANTQHWLVAFPIPDGDGGKLFALKYYLFNNQIDDSSVVIWVQDGFETSDYIWAAQNNVKLLDTTEEPIRSLLLSDNVEDAIQLVNMLVGNEVRL